jgi:membrane associated rhomboid family serine protease
VKPNLTEARLLFPVKDENPTCITPYVTWSLIAINILIFIWEIIGGDARFNNIIMTLGFIPARVINDGTYYMFLTSMFLHGGLFHVLGNMLYLYIFGDNIEDMCGRGSYFVFYLLCGVIASLAYMLSAWNSDAPAVGASGAISGVLGAYILLFPRVRIRTVILLGFWILPVSVHAYVLIGLWFIYQLILSLLAVETGIAYWAHIGGFVAGVALIKLFARRKHLHPLHRKQPSFRFSLHPRMCKYRL